MERKEVNRLYFLLIPYPIILLTLEQIFIKIGSKFISIDDFNIFIYLNIYIILAVLCDILRAIILLFLYRKFDISFIYPLTSISYMLILFISVLIFSDTLTIGKILGCILISLGTYLIGSTKIKKKYINNNINNEKNTKMKIND